MSTFLQMIILMPTSFISSGLAIIGILARDAVLPSRLKAERAHHQFYMLRICIISKALLSESGDPVQVFELSAVIRPTTKPATTININMLFTSIFISSRRLFGTQSKETIPMNDQGKFPPGMLDFA